MLGLLQRIFSSMSGVVGTFYEFFSGAGMVRAGLGDRWRCLFANDIDPKKFRIVPS